MGFLRLFSRSKPKIKVESTKKDGFSGWIKCSQCTEMVHSKEMNEKLNCCPKCNHHYKFSAQQRIENLADKNSFEELFTNIMPKDPLKFVDTTPYEKRTKLAQEKSGRDEAVYAGTAKIEGTSVALAVMDFSYMGGSMGSVVGEKLTRLIELAQERRLPTIFVCSSGGARMQESTLSLMQMAKTSAALARLAKAGVPFITILTNPTTGGVTASFASLGDIILAEPDALIGFAGPRIVEQTIRHKLPPTAQKSEFLLEKGMIDAVVTRAEMKSKIAFFLNFLTGNENINLRSSQNEKELNSADDQLKELVGATERSSVKA